MRILTYIAIPLAVLSVLILLSSDTAGPVILANANAQPTGWVEIIEERTRNGKSFFDPSIPGAGLWEGSGKIHYDGPNWKDIDNTLVPSLASVPTLGLVDLEMTTDDYEFYALQTLNTIPLWFYRNKSAPDTYVTFNPQGYGWTNDLDDIDLISMPQSVIGAVTENRLHWEDAYGPGAGLTLSAQPGRLAKTLTLEAMPRAPAQYILDGGNPALELSFIFGTPSGPNAPEIWVNGFLWGQSARTETVSAVEFRKNGETIFSFAEPTAFDSGFGIASPSFVLAKQGPNLRVSIRVPLSFLENATYPVAIDPTINEQPGVGADDGYSQSAPGFDSSSGAAFVGNSAGNTFDLFSRYPTVAIGQGDTITAAYITRVDDTSVGGTTETLIFLEDSDNAVAPTSRAEHTADVRTTASTTWDLITTDVQSPSIVAVVQEIVDRGSWASGNAMMLLWDNDASPADNYKGSSTLEHATNDPIILHIEFTSGWVNTAPSITNKITSDDGIILLDYSRSFSATDPDTNQTLQWGLNTTNAPFVITVVNGQNRTTWVNATLDTTGSFYVNVTVGDDAALGNETDFVNYTLTVADPLVPIPTTVIERALFFLVGFIPFIMAIGIGFWKEQGPLVIIGGVIGVLLGIWVMVAIYFVFGFMFVGLGILFMYIGWVNTDRIGGGL